MGPQEMTSSLSPLPEFPLRSSGAGALLKASKRGLIGFAGSLYAMSKVRYPRL